MLPYINKVNILIISLLATISHLHFVLIIRNFFCSAVICQSPSVSVCLCPRCLCPRILVEGVCALLAVE